MGSQEAHAGVLAEELGRLRDRTRADQQAVSLPLLVLGFLTVAAAFLPDGGFSPPMSYYWLAAGPAGFAGIAWSLRRRELRLGVGARSTGYRAAAVALAVVLLAVVPAAVVLGAGMAACGVALLVVATGQRDPAFTVAAAGYTAIGVLEALHVLSNAGERLAVGSFPRWPFTLAAGLVLLGVGFAKGVREFIPRADA